MMYDDNLTETETETETDTFDDTFIDWNDTQLKTTILPGMGYQPYCKDRIIRENIKKGHYRELEDVPKYIYYLGRPYLIDHKTKIIAAGYLKIGKSSVLTSLMRGRNEPGTDFRVHAEMILKNAEDLDKVEKLSKKLLADLSMSGPQGQRELYDIDDENIQTILEMVAIAIQTPKTIFDKDNLIDIIEISYFDKDVRTVGIIPFVDKGAILHELETTGLFKYEADVTQLVV